MLIKNVVKKGPKRGTPILYTPEEAAPFAVERGVKGMNTREKIFWVLKKSIKIDTSTSTSSGGETYDAQASGTAQIGYTDVATDKFYAPKEHSFVVRYKSARDEKGIPDIAIVEFDIDRVAKTGSESRPLKVSEKEIEVESVSFRKVSLAIEDEEVAE